MANFPNSLDSLSNPTSTDLLENATAALDHDYQHATANDILEALEAKVGVDSSAVTTSHDYKLSGVATGDKAVSKTGTETLTNKTLTAPQLNFGSDANGDMIYRNGSGVTARLAIGSTDQILAVQSGLPTWIANPSATAASSTTAGIVELATTAETETGTDATRAVTPDGLHDMTTLAGAAWFLDEDTMSSDSATKTASQQSIKAYVDNYIKYILNTTPTNTSTYHTFQSFPTVIDDGGTKEIAGYVSSGWTSSTGATDEGGGGTLGLSTTGSTVSLTTRIPTLTTFGFSSSFSHLGSNPLYFKYRVYPRSNGTTPYYGWGLVDTATMLSKIESSTADNSIRFVYDGTNTYAVTSVGGSARTSTNVTASVTINQYNNFVISVTSTSVLFYINGTLVATHTTNIPTTSNAILTGWGITNSGSTSEMVVGPTLISMPNKAS